MVLTTLIILLPITMLLGLAIMVSTWLVEIYQDYRVKNTKKQIKLNDVGKYNLLCGIVSYSNTLDIPKGKKGKVQYDLGMVIKRIHRVQYNTTMGDI